MKTDMEKLKEMHRNEKDPEERRHLKREMDQIPLSSGEVEQVQQREVDRKTADIEAYHQRKRS